jgi:hypothetical protein
MQEVVASPIFEAESEAEPDVPRVVAAPWWDAMDERTADLLAAKCQGAAAVDLREEAAEPLCFDAGRFAAIFLENLLQPLSLLPQLCVGRWRRGLVERSYLPATSEFAADDELLSALKLTRTGFGSSKVHSLVFGNAWVLSIGVLYCGVRWWDSAPARYFFLLVLIFQFLLRSQWAMKYAYRRQAAERRLQSGTSIDRRAEELLFGFIPLAPWLIILELRLAALTEGVDLGAELVFHGGAAEAEAMFPAHVMRWLPDAVCAAGGASGGGGGGGGEPSGGWAVGRPRVHLIAPSSPSPSPSPSSLSSSSSSSGQQRGGQQRGGPPGGGAVFSVTGAALVYRALVHHSKVTPIDGRPPVRVEFHSIQDGADLAVMLCLLCLGLLPFGAAAIEGDQPIEEFGTGAILIGAFYFSNAPVGVRGFLNAVFVNIRRRTQQQELMGALLSGRPCSMMMAVGGGKKTLAATPRLVRTERNLVAWLGCRAVLLRSFAGIQ